MLFLLNKPDQAGSAQQLLSAQQLWLSTLSRTLSDNRKSHRNRSFALKINPLPSGVCVCVCVYELVHPLGCTSHQHQFEVSQLPFKGSLWRLRPLAVLWGSFFFFLLFITMHSFTNVSYYVADQPVAVRCQNRRGRLQTTKPGCKRRWI